MRRFLKTGPLREHAAGILTLMFLLGDLFLRGANGFSGWSSTWYALDYSIGSGSRLLAGQILHSIKSGFISVHAAYVFVRASCVAVCILAAILADILFRKAGEERKPAVSVFLAIAAAGPFSPRYLWNEVNFGRLDLYLVGVLLAGLILLLRVKRFIPRCVIVCVMSCIGLLFHQVYVFLFFPVMISALLPDVLHGSPVRWGKVLPLLGACAVVLAVFLYLQLYSGVNAASSAELIGVLSERTDLDLSAAALEYEYFHDFFYSFRDLTLPYLRDIQNPILLAITIALLFPAAWVFASFHTSMRGDAAEDGECGFLYPRPYLPLLLLFYLPPFVLTVDWNRWIAAMYYGICLTQLVLCAEGDRHAGRAMEILSERVRKAPAAYVGALLWLAMLSPLTARFYIPEANAVLRLLRSVF